MQLVLSSVLFALMASILLNQNLPVAIYARLESTLKIMERMHQSIIVTPTVSYARPVRILILNDPLRVPFAKADRFLMLVRQYAPLVRRDTNALSREEEGHVTVESIAMVLMAVPIA